LQNAIKLINVQETVITDTHLMYQTFPQKSRDSEIVFTVVSPPQHGVLLLATNVGLDSAFASPQKLRTDTTFTQVFFFFFFYGPPKAPRCRRSFGKFRPLR
jgi:hypothetical protein